MQTSCKDTTDLWDTDQPAFNLTNTGYEEYLFRDRMVALVGLHDPSTPLMLFYTPHAAHCPLQVK